MYIISSFLYIIFYSLILNLEKLFYFFFKILHLIIILNFLSIFVHFFLFNWFIVYLFYRYYKNYNKSVNSFYKKLKIREKSFSYILSEFLEEIISRYRKKNIKNLNKIVSIKAEDFSNSNNYYMWLFIYDVLSLIFFLWFFL